MRINQPTDVGKPFHLLKHKYYQPNLTNTCAKCLWNLLDSSKERCLLMPSAQKVTFKIGLSENRVPQIQWCIIKFPLNMAIRGIPVNTRYPAFSIQMLIYLTQRHPTRGTQAPGWSVATGLCCSSARKRMPLARQAGRRLHVDSVSGLGQLPSRFQAIFNHFPSISGQS